MLNASKDDIPRTSSEPMSSVSLVDPGNAANNLSGVAVEKIKSRGNFTWSLDKKPYQIKFSKSTSVLGMQKAKTWILLANHADASLLRNKVGYDLAASFGLAGTPDSRFVDLTINGEYLGNYLLSEKVEVKTNRVELTNPGGLLLEMDNLYGAAEDFNFATSVSGTRFVLKDAVQDVSSPLAPELAAEYNNVQSYINAFEKELYAPKPDWSRISRYIDVDSFIKYYIVQELAGNPDAVMSSVFFWKDGPNDVLHAGPVWDLDIAFGMMPSRTLGGDPQQDLLMNGRWLQGMGTGWFQEMFRNEEFAAQVSQVYDTQLAAKVAQVLPRFDADTAALAASAAANFQRWPKVLGRPSVTGGLPVPATYQQANSSVRKWIDQRITYMNSVYKATKPVFTYAAHVQDVGWQPAATGGQIVGTVDHSLKIEALDIGLRGNTIGGSIQSTAHIEDVGWTDWSSSDARIGTTGRNLRMEAIRFRLTGALAAAYDVQYRAYVENIGWMNWQANGALAGTTGRALRMEALQVRLVEKSSIPTVDEATVSYSAHVSEIGWMNGVRDGALAGTTGRALAMEALRIDASSTAYDGRVEYRGHIQDVGWTDWSAASPSGYIGTVGQARRLEAVELRLTGDLAQHYAIRYRAHVADIGWQDWVADGTTAGTTGQARAVEAVVVQLVAR